MQIKYLSLMLAVVLASSPALAANKKASKTKKAKAVAAAPAKAKKEAESAKAIYPVASNTATGGYTANMVEVPAGQTPQTPEQWLSRMGDFTQNASAFKDPKTFEAWLAAMTDPNTTAAAIPMMMEPGNWLHMAQSGMQPGVVNNYLPFMMDPSIYLRWTAGMMDPGFYARSLWALSDPNKMMRWMMLPLDPRVLQSGMNMLNPNMYMKWMMAPTDPRAMSLMFAPFNPQLYGSWMGAFINPSLLGSNWTSFMNPTASVVPFGPAAPITLPINVMDPSTWANMLNMFGGFGGMMPSLTGTAGGTPAPSIYASGLPIPGFGPGPNPYLANAQGAPAPAAPSLPSIFPFGAPAPSLANAQAAPAAPSFFPAGAPAKMTLSGDALFRSGKASTRDLTAEGKKGLNELADKIKAAGKIDTIRVTGHADKTGKASYNMKLSLARARSVADYLKSKGVKAAKFITAGKGDTQPVKDCDMKLPKAELVACLQPNRRVEIEVVPAK